MATDEEKAKDFADELLNADDPKHEWLEDVTLTLIKDIRQEGKKEGIQMEHQRLREQIKDRQDEHIGTHINGDKVKYYTIIVSDIDIWDDVK